MLPVRSVAATIVYIIIFALSVIYIITSRNTRHDSRPMMGPGSSSVAELFQVFMGTGTGLWQDGAD